MAMKVRDLIARLVEFRDAGAVDTWGSELIGTLERQARRGQGPTERQRAAAVALLKQLEPALVAEAVSEHVGKLTPEAVERVHRNARGREVDNS